MSYPTRYSPFIEWDDDTNQKEAVMIKCIGGSWIKYDDYARLKAEVERLRASSFVTAVPVEEYEKLKSENERLRKAGDGMYDWLGIVNRHHYCSEREEWLRAKKGLPSLEQQWEREKSNRALNAAKEGKQP